MLRTLLAIGLLGAAIAANSVLEFQDADGSCYFTKKGSKVESSCDFVSSGSTLESRVAALEKRMDAVEKKGGSGGPSAPATATCPEGKYWHHLFDTSSNIPQATSAQVALIKSSTHLFRISTPVMAHGMSLYIYDPAPEFIRSDYLSRKATYGGTSNERHFWRSSSVPDVMCAAGAHDGEPMVSAGTSDMNCAPSGVGSHKCGYGNGWILWHADHTYNHGNSHPCHVGGGLTSFWVCA